MAIDNTRTEDHVRFLESMERINRAVRSNKDLDEMLKAVLSCTLEIFKCDRTWLLHPCDPNAESWQIPFECSKPEYPGVGDQSLPMTDIQRSLLKAALISGEPMTYDAANSLPPEVAAKFQIKSQLHMAIHPRLGEPWLFGLHHCAGSHSFSQPEIKMFKEIGHRIADALSNLLLFNELRANEEKFRILADTSPTAILMFQNQQWIYANRSAEELSGFSNEEILQMDIWQIIHPESLEQAHKLKAGTTYREKYTIVTKAGQTKWVDFVLSFTNINNTATGIINVLDVTEQTESRARLGNLVEHSVDALARTAEIFDTDTGEHTKRIGDYCKKFAELIGADETYQETIRVQAQLHDVGKIHIPPAIINKPGRLTREEFQVIQNHTEFGRVIIGKSPELTLALQIALYHHEKCDGSGYPDGLKGDEIPLAARIAAIADVFDALITTRPYKEALSYEQAYDIMSKGDERLDPRSHFDPNLLDLFLNNYEDFVAIHSESLFHEVERISQKMDILVLDDDPTIREMLAGIYDTTEMQVDVKTFASLNSLKKHLYHESINPRICFIDIHLPDGNGNQVAKALRNRFPGCCLICITADMNVAPKQVALYDRLLHKPFSLEKIQTLTEIISKYH